MKTCYRDCSAVCYEKNIRYKMVTVLSFWVTKPFVNLQVSCSYLWSWVLLSVGILEWAFMEKFHDTKTMITSKTRRNLLTVGNERIILHYIVLVHPISSTVPLRRSIRQSGWYVLYIIARLPRLPAAQQHFPTFVPTPQPTPISPSSRRFCAI